MKFLSLLAIACCLAAPALAEQTIGSVSTNFRLLGPNDREGLRPGARLEHAVLRALEHEACNRAAVFMVVGHENANHE